MLSALSQRNACTSAVVNGRSGNEALTTSSHIGIDAVARRSGASTSGMNDRGIQRARDKEIIHGRDHALQTRAFLRWLSCCCNGSP